MEGFLPQVKWRETTVPDAPNEAKAFIGEHSTTKFTVVSFEIESQGFPSGSRGYDGAISSGMIVCRMTREFAEKAAHLAELACAEGK